MVTQTKTFTGSDEDFAALLQTLGRQDAEMKDPVYGMGYGSSDPRDYCNLWTDGHGGMSRFAKWHLDQGIPFAKLFGPGRPTTLEKMQYAIKQSYYEQGYPIDMLNLPRHFTGAKTAPGAFRRLAEITLRNTVRGAHAPPSALYGTGPVDPIEYRKQLDREISDIFGVAAEFLSPPKNNKT